jgi:aspartyl-tRNA synthetase
MRWALCGSGSATISAWCKGEWAPLWVVNFPMFEWDEHDQRWNALHHPFTAPRTDDPAEVQANPGRCLSRAYDMVLNGSEIGGGSVRIHRQEMQNTVFELLGIRRRGSARQVRLPAGCAEIRLSAARRSCLRPGSAGDADDRGTSIRDVIAFPKTQSAACLLTQAPAPVTETQLRDLNIRLRRTP